MSKEVSFAEPPGNTYYFVAKSQSNGQYVNGTTPEAFVSAHWTSYAIAITEYAGATGQYHGDFPAVAAGAYHIEVYLQAGGSPALSDGPPYLEGDIQWDGTRVVPLGLVLPPATAGTANGLPTIGTGTGQINPDGTGSVPIAFGTSLPTNLAINTVGEALFLADLRAGRSNQARGGTSTTIILDAGAPSNANAFVGEIVYLYSGTGGGIRDAGQWRTVTAYNTSTKEATVGRAWNVVPDSTTRFVMFPQSEANVGLWNFLAVPVGSNGDPWTTSIPGSYTGNQAGAVVGKGLNFSIIDITGVVASSPAPSATAVTITLDNPLNAGTVAAHFLTLSGVYVTYGAGSPVPPFPGKIIAPVVVHSTTSVSVTFAASTFGGAPNAGDPAMISG